MTSEQQNLGKFEGIKRIARKSILPAALGAGALFPTMVYANTVMQDEVHTRSVEISNFLDSNQANLVEGVTLLAGVAVTVNSHIRGKKYDEAKLHVLRVAGSALITTAIGTTLIDSRITIPYVIPAGLTLAGTYSLAATGIIDTFERSRDKAFRASAVIASAGIVGAGATIFLAAANRLPNFP